MGYCLRIFPCILILSVFQSNVFAQQDSTIFGSIKGAVKDTSLNYFLQAATVSVYDLKDKLISYTLTSMYGEFDIDGLPAGMPLQLRVSFVGYKTYLKQIEIDRPGEELNIGVVILEKGAELLDNIVISPPPVRMNKDTLEFSSAAFALDKNAVAEDLLRKLPGVIVWGDGTITVNGREINKLLVDGKPFFNDKSKVALQNIPKTAIEKVQVYREFIDPNNPFDSITSINLKLRKNMHNGFFGTISAGVGTQEKFESLIDLNFFNPRNQLALVAQSNNVNKLANDINTVLRNNTFKGNGVRTEYQPDFDISGVNKQNSGGLLFSHDFIPKYNQYEQDRLSLNSFINQFSNNTIEHTSTQNFVGVDSTLSKQVDNSSSANTTEFNISTRYNKLKNKNSHFVDGNFQSKSQTSQKLLTNGNRIEGAGLRSFGSRNDSLVSSYNKISLKAGIDHQGFFKITKPRLTDWSVLYSFSAATSDTNTNSIAFFIDSTDTDLSRTFNRKSVNKLFSSNHNIKFKLGDFGKVLFRNAFRSSNINMQFENEVNFLAENIDNQIADWDTSQKKYFKNYFLTKKANYREVSLTTGLHLSRNFLNLLANRYQKELKVEVFANMQFSKQSYSAPTQSFQNLQKAYQSFIPQAKVTYMNFQYGEFVDLYELRFNSGFSLPDRRQLFNLPDSLNLYAIRVGNLNLIPSKNYELAFNFKHNSIGRKNDFHYGALVSAGITCNYFADSILVEKSGRNIYLNTNLDGHKYLNLGGFFNKAFVMSNNQIQFNARINAIWYKNPGYFQFQTSGSPPLSVSHIFMLSDSLSLSYTFKDLFAINFSQYFAHYRSRRTDLATAGFKSLESVTSVALGVNPTRKLNINSSILFNSTTSSGFSSIKSTILNASLSYRFLKGDNLEFRISGMDLLNQNKGIINYGNSFSFTHGTVNRLHQYFMATFTFYPRKFGKNNNRRNAL